MTQQGNRATDSSVSTPEDGFYTGESAQLSKLSSVLNGLEGGAQVMHRHIQEALRAVRAGTYHVDTIQLSRRIVGEALRSV
jgi:hypothetical protein